MPNYENVQEWPQKLNAREAMKRNSIIFCLQATTIKTEAGKECSRISVKRVHVQWHNLLSRMSARGKSDTKGSGVSQIHTLPQHLAEIKELILWKGWPVSILLAIYRIAS